MVRQAAPDQFLHPRGAASTRTYPANESAISVRTTASASTTAYKSQIHDQVAGRSPAPEGPVTLELSFTVGRRNWLNLWKPTIDALDPLLGPTSAGRDWHPRDGRIVELGLHCTQDPSLGYDVRIDILSSVRSERAW